MHALAGGDEGGGAGKACMRHDMLRHDVFESRRRWRRRCGDACDSGGVKQQD
jgi:hypothetical protein